MTRIMLMAKDVGLRMRRTVRRKSIGDRMDAVVKALKVEDQQIEDIIRRLHILKAKLVLKSHYGNYGETAQYGL